ncbi:MAG TPA: AI-2E family transporter, partial [Euzebya sp.]|nr:AI-2E family transporter [Euzebya sp.]
GGLFPIVGATISGFLAALVALASNGPGTAALVIVLVLAVQNIEGQVLQPLILGRALSLHPLAIIVALAVGGFLLGILGAFLAVPVAAAGAQTVGYLRKRIPG